VGCIDWKVYISKNDKNCDTYLNETSNIYGANIKMVYIQVFKLNLLVWKVYFSKNDKNCDRYLNETSNICGTSIKMVHVRFSIEIVHLIC